MTAAEEATAVVAAACRWTGQGFDPASPEDAVAALMAKPDLLARMAIEAGGLVALSNRFGWKPDPDFPAAIVNTDGEAARDAAWLPLYRRRKADR